MPARRGRKRKAEPGEFRERSGRGVNGFDRAEGTSAHEGSTDMDGHEMAGTNRGTADGNRVGEWAGAGELVTHELWGLWTAGLKELLRASTQIGQLGIDVTREVHVAAQRWQACWPDALRGPIVWYERTARETVENTRRVVGLTGGIGSALTEFTERLMASAETSRHRIEDAFLEVEPLARRRRAV